MDLEKECEMEICLSRVWVSESVVHLLKFQKKGDGSRRCRDARGGVRVCDVGRGIFNEGRSLQVTSSPPLPPPPSLGERPIWLD